tara:strand:+ start:10662 stop:11210 length:549 start_codon:yes stop_codon:yes gene_type:complete
MSNQFSSGASVVDGEVSKDWPLSQYDDEVYPLGTRRVQLADEVNAANSTHYGDREWVFVYNDETSTDFAEGDLIKIDTTSATVSERYAPFHGILSNAAATSAGLMLGVAGGAIAAGKYGWVVSRGVCEAKGDGSVNQGESIVSHTSGQVDTMASGEEAAIIGVALEDDGSAGDKFTVKVFIP